MSFENIEKIFDFFNFTKSQLKIISIIAVALIGVFFYVGVEVTEFKRDVKEVKDNTNKNTELIKDIKKDVDNIKDSKGYDYEKFYNDMSEMNKTNNDFWNTKFDILIKYGNTNKQMLIDLIDLENQKQKMAEEYAKKEVIYKKDTAMMKKKLKIGVKKD